MSILSPISKLFRATIKRKKLLLVLFIVIAILYFAYQRLKPAEVGERYVVKSGSFQETVEAPGKVQSGETTTLSFIAPSKVVWVGVEIGDTVVRGQGVASVDKRELQNELQRNLLSYMQTRWDFNQLRDDYDAEGKELDKVLLSDEERRILEKSQFELNQSVLDVELADLALQESVLTSPISGTVVDIKNLRQGENIIQPSLSYIKITNFDTLYFRAEVDEADFGKIKLGQKAVVTFDAFPGGELVGEVSTIEREAQTSETGGTDIIVRVAINPDTLPLIVGMNGDAEFIVSEKESTLLIPRTYVVYKGEDTFVNKLENGKVLERKIELGSSSNTQVEVTSGLSEGDTIALPGN